ncbi:hypothetical protein BN946_scf185002.g73 [Trametes cinnabarina]|uniref:Uncharacterized protein n=1 Tax=Pycnoporus cinnabarinus TaxID=5643 RepID=A0A060SKE8_PYCCI|nr:hypothetical protein BN946_scf185002.g73 [Trametes cinnabarina]
MSLIAEPMSVANTSNLRMFRLDAPYHSHLFSDEEYSADEDTDSDEFYWDDWNMGTLAPDEQDTLDDQVAPAVPPTDTMAVEAPLNCNTSEPEYLRRAPGSSDGGQYAGGGDSAEGLAMCGRDVNRLVWRMCRVLSR